MEIKQNLGFEYKDKCAEDDSEENDALTQFLLAQINMLLDLKQHLEGYLDTLPVFGFNSSQYHINLIKSYLKPYLVDVRDIEPMVIKKANQFVSFKFGSIQLLDIMNFLGGATSLNSFLKAYKTTETKVFFHMSGLTAQKSYSTLNCPHTLIFSASFETNPWKVSMPLRKINRAWNDVRASYEATST